jgi:aminodeoxyfutalosine synthase
METMTALQDVAERISRGDVLSNSDAQLILETDDIVSVGMLADEVRRQRHGTRTTFVRVYQIHVAAPSSPLPPRVHAGEFRIIGTPVDADAAEVAVRSAAALAGSVPLTGFSLADLRDIAGSTPALGSLCSRLRGAGLKAIADVPVDLLGDAAAAVKAARGAGLDVLRLTVHAAADDSRCSMVDRARALQDEAGGFAAFAPLPRTFSVSEPTTGYDDVKQVALARLLVGNIPSIQVDWPLYGPKLAQVALTMGADDVDGVEASDPGVLGTRRSPIEEIKGNIRAAFLEPAERDGRFDLLPG